MDCNEALRVQHFEFNTSASAPTHHQPTNIFAQTFPDMDFCGQIMVQYTNICEVSLWTKDALKAWVAKCLRYPITTCVIVACLFGLGCFVCKYIQRGKKLKQVTEERDAIDEDLGIVKQDRDILEEDRDHATEQLSTAYQKLDMAGAGAIRIRNQEYGRAGTAPAKDGEIDPAADMINEDKVALLEFLSEDVGVRAEAKVELYRSSRNRLTDGTVDGSPKQVVTTCENGVYKMRTKVVDVSEVEG